MIYSKHKHLTSSSSQPADSHIIDVPKAFLYCAVLDFVRKR